MGKPMKYGRRVPLVLDSLFGPFDRSYSGDLIGDLLNDLEEDLREYFGGIPAVNVKETEKEYIVEATIPGYKKEEIGLRLTEGGLEITAKREKKEEKEEEGKYYRREISTREARRVVSLPGKVIEEKVDAEYKDGILTITLPKKEPQKPEEKKIKIK